MKSIPDVRSEWLGLNELKQVCKLGDVAVKRIVEQYIKSTSSMV